jgi:hypothetical protein
VGWLRAAARRAKAVSAVLAVAAASTVIAGCGGSSGGNSDQVFIAKAKAVVCPLGAEFAKLQTQKPSALAELPAYTQRAAALFDTLKQRLVAIPPPSDKAAAYARLLTAIDNFTKAVREAGQAASEGNVSRVQSDGQSIEALAPQIDSAGKELGGGECPKP